ncbi:MAG: hypothetical protein LUG84_00495 [Akkermansiaceae bacterium]|nr:hypothetical protein [Akkermansiaceae bacterium]
MNAELLTTAHSYLTQMSIHAAAYRTLLGERDADEDSCKNAEINNLSILTESIECFKTRLEKLGRVELNMPIIPNSDTLEEMREDINYLAFELEKSRKENSDQCFEAGQRWVKARDLLYSARCVGRKAYQTTIMGAW